MKQLRKEIERNIRSYLGVKKISNIIVESLKEECDEIVATSSFISIKAHGRTYYITIEIE